MKKTLKKALNITVRTITYVSIPLLFLSACAVENTVGLIIYCSCLTWLCLMGLLAWLEYKFNI